MSPTRACILILLTAALVLPSIAQVSPVASQKPAGSAIEGIVIKDPGSEPVKKTVIELIAEGQQQGGNYTSVSGPDGRFRIDGVMPGRYHLFAERSGYVESTDHGGRSRGRILTVTSGQDLKDIQIRFAAAATITGRITDEDGDPLENAEVTVLRRTFTPGRSRLQQVRAERTNDLGEYRIPGLAAGNYYLSVSPPLDFKSLLDSESSQAGGNQNPGRSPDKPAASYQTTYYPGTSDRSQAEPLQLHPGDEFPANFSLTRSLTLSIRGSVANLPLGSSATILLLSSDFHLVFNGGDVRKDGTFMIHDVAPGPYTILATVDNAPVPMTARQSLHLTSNNVEDLRLVPQTGATIRGRIHLENKAGGAPVNGSQMLLALQPADGDEDGVTDFGIESGFSPLVHVANDGSFQWNNVPPGNYSLHLGTEDNAATDWFLVSVLAGGHSADLSSISVDGGVIALDVVASAKGGVVEGIVIDSKNQPIPDAVVLAAPETSPRSHADRLRRTVADQRGRFSLHGIPPGQYSFFASQDVDGDAYYDPEFLRNYEQQAIPLGIVEGDHKSIQLQVISTSPDDQ